jgi:uncharacterized pyridoxal phosphate-containing UPF0001 family protein
MLVKGVLPYGKLVIETVGSKKVCDKLDRAMSDFQGKLSVLVQVNTSGTILLLLWICTLSSIA